jgi:type IV pilus assembly protein PilM
MLIDIGTRPVVFDCDLLAVANIHELCYRDVRENALVLDIGNDSTKVMLKDAAGVPTLVRSISIGGSHLTESLSRSLSIDLQRGEALKVSGSQSGSLLQDPNIAGIATRHIDELLAELNQTLDFYTGGATGEAANKVDSIFLSGGAATTAGLAHALSQGLRAKVEFIDPFRALDVPARIHIPDDVQAHVFATSIGLALRSNGDKPA